MKLFTALLFAATASASFATSVIVTNSRGPANTREIANVAGLLETGFGAFGILNESGIKGLATTFEGLGFNQYGVGAGGATTINTSGQFSFTDNLNLDLPANAAFVGKNIYLLVGFGGSSLATATNLFVYKFETTYGLADSGQPITATLSSTPGTTLLGTEVGNPTTAAAGRYNAATITFVPEPSTAIMGAVAALGLLRRRRN